MTVTRPSFHEWCQAKRLERDRQGHELGLITAWLTERSPPPFVSSEVETPPGQTQPNYPALGLAGREDAEGRN